MDVIPENCLSLLPFLPQSVSSWNDEADLLEYLYCLFDCPCEIIDNMGSINSSNYRDYGKYLFENGVKDFTRIASEFEENAKKIKHAPTAKEEKEEVPNFAEDKHFGLMAKYAIAWDGTVNAVLSESAFFSIEHVLESLSEIECSILLASNLYYKQSLQILRNFLEEILIELHFCCQRPDFNNWKQKIYRIPPLRGPKGVLKRLVVKGILQDNLADEIADLYGKLSSSVHGEEDKFINTGIFNGDWSGKHFRYTKFLEWCAIFARCVDAGIRILQLTVIHWRNASPTGIFCNICHSNNAFELIEKILAGERAFVTLKCRNCGSTSTFDAAYASEHGYLF